MRTRARKRSNLTTQQKKVKRRAKRKESFKSYIYKVHRIVNPGTQITNKAMSVMNSFINDMFERLAEEAKRMTRYGKRKTISSQDVQAAVKTVIPGELGRFAVREGNKAINKITNPLVIHKICRIYLTC